MDRPKGPPQEPSEDAMLRRVSERLRRMRKAHSVSLRDLAAATGISASFLSQLERGLTRASTSTLIRLAASFGTNLSELFQEDDRPADGVVLRKADRPALPSMGGQRKMLLSRRPLTHFEAYAAEFAPGGSSGDDLYTHGDSLEMLIVQRGTVRLDLGQAHHVLEAGDCAEYASSTPHRVSNAGEGTAEVLFIISPPTLSRREMAELNGAQMNGAGQTINTGECK